MFSQESGASESWSYDFVMDHTSDGRRLRILVVVDEYLSISAEMKNERKEEARLSIEVDDFKEVIYADLKTKAWLVKAKVEKKQEK